MWCCKTFTYSQYETFKRIRLLAFASLVPFRSASQLLSIEELKHYYWNKTESAMHLMLAFTVIFGYIEDISWQLARNTLIFKHQSTLSNLKKIIKIKKQKQNLRKNLFKLILFLILLFNLFMDIIIICCRPNYF